ncbi:MAG: DEAD/DEAH box helicase family protein [Clostridia bacterium]|nr:DEAD/DEAH box helicase family protein [Clostridia bacterium]
MDLIDNLNRTLKDDLTLEIHEGSKISIAAACFSIYAFQELKQQLKDIDELRFIFTSPTFTTEKAKKEKREFYIPRLNRERSLYGTEFEVKLRNELTQKAIAKECAEWIRSKVTFKSNITNEVMLGFMNVDESSYMPIQGFTTVDLGCERGNNVYYPIQKTESYENTNYYLNLFNELWISKDKLQEVTDEVIENITTAYNENSPEFIYFVTLYNIFNEFLEDISEDVLPNEATGFKDSKIWSLLYNFQKDAALAIINKLEKYNGCILADSVGLGKTFTALAVIKYYESRNKSVLVLCPKKLSNNWNTYRDNYINNQLAEDRLNYKVLYHTDLGRTHGFSNGTDLARLRWDTYDLIVIDESHNFRNGGKLDNEDESKDNRYATLLKQVIRKGVKTKVLMLSATPVNTRFNDLKNQLQLAYEGDSSLINDKLNTSRNIDEIFKSAQKAFNEWSKFKPRERTTDKLLQMLDFDFFEVLDSVTIARSRKHIEKYYDTSAVGKFPERLPPKSHRPHLTDLKGAISYNEIFEQLTRLNLDIYRPSHYIQPSKMEKYAKLYGDNVVNVGFTQASRELGIRRLMAINLMKRMESSVYSFQLTLKRIKDLIENTIALIDDFDANAKNLLNLTEITDYDEYDFDDQNSDDFIAVGKKVQIDLADMDRISWRGELAKDLEILELLTFMVADITPAHDSKLQELFSDLANKINNPINGTNKKVIIFTAFADTAMYLYDNISEYIYKNFGLCTAVVTGSVEGRTNAKLKKADLNTILTCFSPKSKDRDLFTNMEKVDIDILIATDCISEGQNLQDCDYLINYDIHWNPVRIIQRFGRIDRIGSKNNVIQLVNFWPDITLDDYINLKSKVETRMKIVNMAATGDDDILSDEEKHDLEYRKEQLMRLQKEVFSIEEMSTGISIMDLGLNEFRLDLLDYIKRHPEIERTPMGLHAIAPATDDCPAGVFYVLKNRTQSVNIDDRNRLHPFYMVYVSEYGDIICDYLQPKKLLDTLRYLCKGKEQPVAELYRAFNKETKDGKEMGEFSSLLSDAINSIIDVKEESDIDSLFKAGGTSALMSAVSGLDDFELICFLVVK